MKSLKSLKSQKLLNKADTIESRARFDIIRYAQCWEDADILLAALDPHKDDVVLSIASAGDNSFSLLARNPKKVYAIDLNPAQIACCELRKVMYRVLNWEEHLRFGGVVPDKMGKMDRLDVFHSRLETLLPPIAREYWEQNKPVIERGFMTAGKFERYFGMFRNLVLPLVHTKSEVDALLTAKSADERLAFYNNIWENARYSAMFKLFFSRLIMGRLGRDKEFFRFVKGGVADRILARSKHALTSLDPSQNPYLHFILKGSYDDCYPHALRPENYEKIRANLNNIEFRLQSAESFIKEHDSVIDAFNLSDIFEYMSPDSMNSLYDTMLKKAAPGARFAYWNMLAPRALSHCLREKYHVQTNEEQNERFLMVDKAFFYSKFHLDVVSK